MDPLAVHGKPMNRLQLAAALLIASPALVPGTASEASLLYEIQVGATLQLDAGPVEALSGSLRIRCQGAATPTGACSDFGDVTYDVTRLELGSASLSLSGAGAFTPLSNGGVSLSAARLLSLSDVGVLLPGNPPKDAALGYGFDGELVFAGATFDRYRVWTLGFPPSTTTWTPSGVITPARIDFSGQLVETFYDLDVSGLVTQTTGSTADLSFTALLVPEPATGLLLGAGLAALAARRRAARTRAAH
jgi:hypothetical protein